MAEGNWGSAGMHKVDIRNDLMFSYVMRNPEICTELLEVLLPGHKIARVEYIELESERDGAPQAAKARKNRPDTQKALLSAIDKRGVRLDAYLDDGKTIYNIEMQTAEYGALPQRARLYQAHIDINQLERGQNFDELRPSYVIFICTFDPFGQSRYQYSFRNVCRETGEELQDEAYKLFFNTTGTKGEISPSLREMLQYINNPGAYPVQKSKVELIHQIETAVEEANQDEEWRRMYMTWQIRQREAELLGEKRGIAIGEKRGIAIGEKRGEERGGKAWHCHRRRTRGKARHSHWRRARRKARQAGNGAGHAEGTAHRPGRALHGPLAGRTTIAGRRNCAAGLAGACDFRSEPVQLFL